MTFKPIENPNISKLAWFLMIEQDTEEITLIHGPHIDADEHFFVEGAWDGAFKDMNFDQSSYFLGTGGKIIKDKLVLCTPGHTQERIYGMKEKNTLFFSNSLPFILKKTNSTTDKNFYKYEEYFASILRGLKHFEREIPLAEHKKLRLYYYCNLEIDSDLTICIKKKTKSPDFQNYDEYSQFQHNYLKRLKANISSPDRKINYGLVTTISAGYDAVACASFVKNHGCNTAVTFNRPKKYKEDSGEEIARVLGYENIYCANANQYLKNEDFIEAEYLCSGELGSDIVFSAFDDHFKNNVVFTGLRGDLIYSVAGWSPNEDFRFEEVLYTDSCTVEHRLWVGYIEMHLPLLGADRWESIFKISHSKELEPYSVGGDYNRPIARKMAEDMGVPRELFGQKKNGAGFNYRFDTRKRMKSRMSKRSYNHFINHYQSDYSFKRFSVFLKYLYDQKGFYINFLLKKLKINYKFKLTYSLKSNPFAPLDLFNWSIKVMKERY